MFSHQDAPPAIPVRTINPIDEAKTAITGNLANFDLANRLAGNITNADTSRALSTMERLIPGYSAIQKQFTDQAQQDLAHPYDLPAEVQQNLGRLAAERGINVAGTGSGQFGQFSTLRDLGLNMLNYGQNRIGQAQSLLSTVSQLAPRVNPTSPLAFMISPQEQLATSQWNATNEQAVAQGGANARTAADNANNAYVGQSFGQAAGALGQVGQFNQVMKYLGSFGGTVAPATINLDSIASSAASGVAKNAARSIVGAN